MYEWKLAITEEYERAFKYYEKKHRDELIAVLNNLDSYFRAIKECGSPLLIKTGFVHNEPMGVKAIDQKCGGIKKKLQATRLYLYPNVTERILVLLTIGNKQTQSKDIEKCRKIVSGLGRRS